MRVVGLTGQSGAGKSTVAAVFRRQGIPVLDCDLLAHEVVASPACTAELAEAFSQRILNPDGSLNRRLLGAMAFSSPEATALLNAITHPRIMEGLRAALAGNYADCPLVVLDAPTLYESGADALCEQVIAVVANRKTLVRRIVRRDGIPAEQAEARLARQKPVSFFAERADRLLSNNGGRLSLLLAARRLARRLKEGRL